MNIRNIGITLVILLLCAGMVSCIHESMKDTVALTSDGTIFYVSMMGDDSNPGSMAQPFRTIQKAASVMTAGDTVYVREGIYEETITPRRSGTHDQWIKYLAYPGETVIINGDAVDADAGVSVKNREYLLFEGFRVKGGRVAGGLVQGPAAYIRFENMTITENRYGLYFFGWDDPITDCQVRNCTITENDEHGVFVYRRVSDMIIADTHISFNGWSNDWGHNIKVVVWDEDTPSTGPHHIVIRDNELDHARMQGIMTWNAHHVLIENNHCHHNGATGIMVENGCSSIIVEGNICEDNGCVSEFETGIWIDDARNVVIQDNQISDNPIGFSATGCEQIIVRRNLIFGNNHSVLDEKVTITGLRVDGAAESGNQPGKDNIIVHNTLYRNGHRRAQRGGVSIGDYSHPPFGISDTVFVNNIVSETIGGDLFVGSGGHLLEGNGYFSDDAFSCYWLDDWYTWSDYLRVSGQDQHSFVKDPLFINPDDEVFQLEGVSPCIDSGIPLTQVRSNGSGFLVPVDDARLFCDGYDLVEGDWIMIGDNPMVQVVAVDEEASVLTVDQWLSFHKDDPVSYDFNGDGPDRGALETIPVSSFGGIEGTVVAVESGKVLMDAQVTIGSWYTVSDENGWFQINGIPVGVYEVVVRCMGYQTQIFPGVVIIEDEIIWMMVECPVNILPNAPIHLMGPETVRCETVAGFSCQVIDPDGDLVAVGWDWDGDGRVDEYSPASVSGSVVEMRHVFQEKGSHIVQVIAVDEHGGVSDWSEPIVVRVSRQQSGIWSMVLEGIRWVSSMWRIH